MSDDDHPADAEERKSLPGELLSFWTDRDEWPQDRPSHIFLARAVDKLGKARFDDWVGVAKPQHADARDQRSKVFEELLENLASGRLATFTRAIKGGPYELIEPHVWNTEIYRTRFKYCRINRDKPFSEGSAKGGWYLFLDRPEFEALVSAGPRKALQIDDADSLPTFLALLIRTADALDLTSRSAPLPAKVIGAKFEALAQLAGIPSEHVSDSVLRYAATFLRPPGAKRTAQQK